MRRRDSGFTLIELLTVIAIIAILAAILLPVLGRAREQARRSTCSNNLRQLAVAATMYTSDYSGRLPSVWDGSSQNAASGSGGWITFAARTGNAANAPDPTVFDPKAGSLWEYTGNEKVYQCPDDEYAPFGKNSYAINGWLSRQAKDASGNLIQNGSSTFYIGYKLARFKNPADTMMFIEEGLVTNNGLLNNIPPDTMFDTTDDGYFFVGQYGANSTWKNAPTRRHGKGFNIVYVDGHADYSKFSTQVMQELWADPIQ